MRIYPQLPKPISRSRSGACILGLTALLVLACRDASAPTIGAFIPPPETPSVPSETPPTEIAAPPLAYVAWSGGSAGIVVLDATGAGVRLSPRDAWHLDLDPAWSPDGSRIAFTSGENGGKLDIYTMNANGGNRVRLTTDASSNVRPAWSHDGARIAFVSNRDGQSEIYVMNADGSHQSRLTFTENSHERDPAWSPDGTRIAFARCEPGLSGYCTADSSTRGGILVITADGAETVRLTSNYTDTAPAWSPDGSRIAFSSETSGTSQIFVMNADGSGRALYSPFENATDPSWSPDGTRIAFVGPASCDYSDEYCYNLTQIFIAREDGSISAVGNTNGGDPFDPAWRP